MLDKSFLEKRLAEVEMEVSKSAKQCQMIQSSLEQAVAEHHAIIGRKSEVVRMLTNLMDVELKKEVDPTETDPKGHFQAF